MYNSFYLLDIDNLNNERIDESISSIAATTNQNPIASGAVAEHVDKRIDKVLSRIVDNTNE
jgi:hypothetical protein